ncbi:MAG TPA: hypothetical protein VFR02_07070, partial [bacterium]|nr:hypothetical protein [bacterium]
VELPVLDITHPAFRPPEGAGPGPWFAFLKQLPPFAWVREKLGPSSVLQQGLRRARGGFLSGMDTYLFKLGPDNLGRAYAGARDRKMAGGALARSLALRTAAMARMLAQGLAPQLRARPGRPLDLINLGGGPAMDSLNALILLAQKSPRALRGRRVTIHVLDLEAEGPDFGARALAALQKPGGPLAGLRARLRYVRYDWAAPAPLLALLRRCAAGKGVMAGSAEGSLFSYASDGQIAEHLALFQAATPASFRMVGSLAIVGPGPGPALRDRGPEELAALARSGGWRARFTGGSAFSRHFYLEKTGKG